MTNTKQTHNWIYTNPQGKVVKRVPATGKEHPEAGNSILKELQAEYGEGLTVEFLPLQPEPVERFPWKMFALNY